MNRPAVYLCLATSLGCSWSCLLDAAETDIVPAPAFSAQQLTDVPRSAWVTYGGTLAQQRYSPLEEIHRGNVSALQAEWRTHLNGSGVGAKYSGHSQPLFYQGTLYVSTGANDVFAVDVDSGAILWHYQAHLDPAINVLCCGVTSRGLALADGKIFTGQVNGKLLALDQRTGEVVWEVQAERWQEGFSITTAPLYYDGLVFTGFGGGEYGIRGRVKAYDAATGDLVWTFYTVPGPGETGHETWPQDSEVWKYGGVPVWQTPSIDPELGLIYFSTGNPAPDMNGANRPGDNLFGISIVAVDVHTGEYRWHYQQVHHDLWDLDAANPIILFDVTIAGQPRKALAQIPKTGWVYILDRVTGEPLLGIEERPVPQEPRQATAATQPYPIGDAVVPQSIEIAPEGYHLVNQGRIFTPYWNELVLLRPGPTGGANWPPSSYDPDTHLMYICAHDNPGAFSGGRDNGPPQPDSMYTGGTFGPTRMGMFGIFAAMDLTTNRLAWRQRWQDICYSGSIVTRGGLVFVGRNDGRMTALDKQNGDKLWEFQTDAGVNAPPITFEHRGRQYLAVFSGGSFFPGTKRGDSLWLFSLHGEMASLPADPAAGAVAVLAAPGYEADMGSGRQIYSDTCAACHGVDGKGGHGGMPLTAGLDVQSIMSTSANGRNDMPPFFEVYTREQLQDVASYIMRDIIRAE